VNVATKKIFQKFFQQHNIGRKGLAFLLFLLVAFLFWLFLKLDETYEHQVSFRFQIVGLPKNYVLQDHLPLEIHYKLEGKGWDLLKIKRLSRNSILSLNYAVHKNQNKVKTINLDMVHKNYAFTGVKILHAEPEYLSLRTDKLMEKELQVYPDFIIVSGKNYGLAGPIKLTPEKIRVYGPENVISKMDSIYTMPLELLEVKSNAEGMVTLKKEEKKNVIYEYEKVRYHIKVEELTEGSIEVDVRVRGTITGKIQLIPDKVHVRFKSVLSRFPDIDSSAFQLAVNLLEKRTHYSDNKLRVQLLWKAPYIYSVRIEPEYVYVIIEKNAP
jgi:hypothetical protein